MFLDDHILSRMPKSAFIVLALCAPLTQAQEAGGERKALIDSSGIARLVDTLEFSDRLHISGYGNFHMMNHDGVPEFQGSRNLDDSLYQLREFSLFIDAEISENIISSAEVGVAKNFDNATLNYLYTDFDVSSMIDSWDEERLGNFKLRLGKFLVPFLSYNENKPNFRQNLMSQPFTAWQLAPVISSPPDFDGLGWSDTGVYLNWNRETGDAGIIDFKLAVIRGLRSGSSALDANSVVLDTFITPPGGAPFQPAVRPRDGLLQNEASSFFNDNNDERSTVAKATYRLSSLPIDFGVSWYSGAWDDRGNKGLQMRGEHFNWISRNLTLKAEHVHADVEQSAGVNPVTLRGPAALNTSTGDYNMDAWYVEGSYIPYRYGTDGQRYIRAVVRYDEVDTNDKVAFTPWDRSRITLGAEWQFDPNARLRFEWQTSELDDFSRAPLPFKNAGGEEDIQMVMLSLIFWF